MTVAERAQLTSGAGEFGLVLDSATLDRFAMFAGELSKWNSRINLTAIRRLPEVISKHFLDSLSITPIVTDGLLADIGSGAGFPGIPLSIVLPHIHVVSVDAVEKKIFFQRHVSRLLGLQHFQAVHSRVENLPAQYAGSCDWVVSRAFSDLPSFVRLALPLLKPAGRLLAMKGREGAREYAAVATDLRSMGIELTDLREFVLPGSDERRCLLILSRA